MEKPEKRVLTGAGVGVFCCFLPWFSISAGGDRNAPIAFSHSMNALDDWRGVVAFLALLATGAALFVDRLHGVTWSRSAKLALPLATSAVAVLFALFYMSGGSGGDMLGLIRAGRTFWYYVALVAAIATAWFAFDRWQAAMRGPTGAGTGTGEGEGDAGRQE